MSNMSVTTGAVAQAAERERSDELSGVGGQNDVHLCAQLCQLAGEVEGLVAGDAAGDAQHHVLALEN